MKLRGLSTRAINALLAACHGWPIDSNRLGSLTADMRARTPAEMLAKLETARLVRPWVSIRTMLLATKGCGMNTLYEIAQWMGGETRDAMLRTKAHVCVCRSCDKRMP
jgi:hypothetical protein